MDVMSIRFRTFYVIREELEDNWLEKGSAEEEVRLNLEVSGLAGAVSGVINEMQIIGEEQVYEEDNTFCLEYVE